MARISTPGEFASVLGLRPVLNVPSSQWLAGPFDLSVVLDHDAALNYDLTAQDVWYGDVAVRKAYSPANGGTDRLRAYLHLEAVQLLLVDAEVAKLDIDTLDKITAEGTRPYLTANVGGNAWGCNLIGAISSQYRMQQPTQGTAADGERAVSIVGEPKLLPSPIRVNLDEDALKLESDAAVALGADYNAVLRVWGALIPSSEMPGHGDVPGCGVADSGLPIAAERMLGLQRSALYPARNAS